MTSDRELKKI